jgi:hypothetical protein
MASQFKTDNTADAATNDDNVPTLPNGSALGELLLGDSSLVGVSPVLASGVASASAPIDDEF